MRHLLLLILLTVLCAPLAISQVAITAKPGLFNEWGLMPAGIYGLAPVSNPTKRAYYKIWKPDPLTIKVQSYDAAGIVTETDVFRLSQGLVSQQTRTNEWGNTFEIDHYTQAGPGQMLVSTLRNGANTMLPAKQARYTYKLNQLVETDYLSADKKPINGPSGVAITRYKRISEPACFGRTAEISFFDADGAPVVSTSWDAHKVIYTYDARCNNTSQAYYGIEDEPLTNRVGGFMTRDSFDTSDREVLDQIVGLNGEITRNSYGTAQASTEYTDGFATRVVRMDPDGHASRMTQAGDGIAIIHYQYS